MYVHTGCFEIKNIFSKSGKFFRGDGHLYFYPLQKYEILRKYTFYHIYRTKENLITI